MDSPGLFDPPDQEQRALIETDLATTMLVEAAAGTGKTTSMVGRMVELLGEGVCRVDRLAAVTFTRKATAELRDRFQVRLERALNESTGERRDRLVTALAAVEQCFIGTIHSFCARLLRERPIEAGIDVAFEELDEDEEYRLRCIARDEHIARLHAVADPSLKRLDELGLEPAQLRATYIGFAQYPDVDEWPAPAAVFDDALADEARRELRAYTKHMEEMVADGLPESVGNDRLMPLFHALPRRLRNTRLSENRRLMEILEDMRSIHVVQKVWPGGPTQGRRERDRYRDFVTRFVTPLVGQWRRQRYGPILDLLRGAVARYDAIRADRGVLSYQDLLMKAAALLRDKPHIRRYFRGRFTHLLVDEFQDTDPIQAEVMLLLTADDLEQRDWRKCRPEPGALFVVGDPKQAIYRFRRADIVTYNEVRAIVEQCGRIVALTANFRTIPPLIEWFNTVSADLFATPSVYAPADTPMLAARTGDPGADAIGVTTLAVPDLDAKEVPKDEARDIARIIRDAIDRRLTVPRSASEIAGGAPPHVVPGDFLILTRRRHHLIAYARALQAFGLPVEVTGGTAVNELAEVALLHTVLAAVVETDDPVAFVGALRSDLFGISDTTLYQFRRAGGKFGIFRKDGTDELPQFEPIAEARRRLRQYSAWVTRLQPLAAIERIAGDLRLYARAASGDEGRDRAGGFCKAIELLRTASREYWTVADLVGYLCSLIHPDPAAPERHDGIPLSPHAEPAVRIMNLHQAKGLEAPIVFLADGSGGPWTRVNLYVERGAGPVRGYLQLRTAGKNGRQGRVLAEPDDWEAKQEQEQFFQSAEEDRLLYVAATRAGAQLVISRASSRQRWQKLAAHVPDTDVVAVPPEAVPPAGRTQTLADDAASVFAGAIAERWAARCAPTYAVKQVKTLTVTGSKSAAHPGEHGTEWGTVLHLLLEAAMTAPTGDLVPLAASALREHDLDPAEAMLAVTVVRSVMRSELWERATAGDPCMTEVPIQFLQPPDGNAVPAIVRGVIDLVFREPGGWVIVDYKTDDREGESVEPLVEHYPGQVRLYAEAWAGITGEPVSEIGLYFVRTGQYRSVTAAAAGA